MTSDSDDGLAARFEAHRTHLRAVALRMLGSGGEADDAVQEAWLRLSRAEAGDAVDNLGGWLRTVVGRICLDMLRSRRSRREQSFEDEGSGPDLPADELGPEREALLADAIGPALLVVLETLEPAERLAFVLHDMFAVPFDEIAEIVGRSTDATRQLASRARRRVQGATMPDAGRARRREVVAAFLAAAREGDFDALLALLDPNVRVVADVAAKRLGAAGEVHGADAVARRVTGRAGEVRSALIDGRVGAALSRDGKPLMLFDFTVEDGKILEIRLVADPARLAGLDIVIVEA